MTKTEFYTWLEATSPPHRINIQGLYHCFEVVCKSHEHPLVMLVQCETIQPANRHARKYRRWLAEFEEAERKEK